MNNPTDWSARQYLQFEDERTRPARDLLAQIPLERPERVVDLGCGPGNSTELLAARWPEAETIGVDSAPDMIAAARQRLPDITFLEADLIEWTPDAPVDVIYANAVFQWIPDHLAALDRLMDHLVPGGVLAVQMPDNLSEPTHRLMETVARSEPFADAFAGRTLRRPSLPEPRAYFDRLTPKSSRVDVWHTIYNHPLADAAAIVEWVKGTGLRPYLEPLAGDRRAAYLAAYLDGIREAYLPMADGRVLLRFPRLFLVAVKA